VDLVSFDQTIGVAHAGQSLAPHSQEHKTGYLPAALNRLPVEFREILVLREIEKLSYKQIASALNVSADTVISRLSQARRRLRQEVAAAQDQKSQNEL
jgi:RNA polymerase sigma-70 factor (ECF subfamily)